jgi:hypothetical protein
MNINPSLPIDNRDSSAPLAVMTADDARKFSIIATHWPVRIVGGPVAGSSPLQEAADGQT